MSAPVTVLGYINPVTKEPYWQEFSFARWDDIPSRWLYHSYIVYQRFQDGTITVIKHPGCSDHTKDTEEQLRQDLIDCAVRQRANPDQLTLPLFPAPSQSPSSSLCSGVDPTSGMHSTWLQQSDKEDI